MGVLRGVVSGVFARVAVIGYRKTGKGYGVTGSGESAVGFCRAKADLWSSEVVFPPSPF